MMLIDLKNKFHFYNIFFNYFNLELATLIIMRYLTNVLSERFL